MPFVPVASLSIRLIFVPVGAADCQYFFSFDRNGNEQIRIANLCLKMIRGWGDLNPRLPPCRAVGLFPALSGSHPCETFFALMD